ncbi:MAG TPA: Holliday junction resolvase RuvX [Bacteroidetes bacterium]|nr:Holliday junction resolvase RuvX [Bacteroidota bacterium]
MGRVLALDWGRVRIGVALSDPTGSLASPYRTLSARPRETFLRELAGILREEEVELVLIGLPLHMNGSEGESAEAARALAAEVETLGVPVRLWDERLSSFTAESNLREAGRKPSRDKARVDRVAAAILLQEFLDSGES